MKRAFVDANVILRFLTGDPPDLADRAQSLFTEVDTGETVLVLEEIVVAETVWVLQSFYGYEHGVIAQVLSEIVSRDGIETGDRAGLLTALHLYAARNVDFADALVAVRMGEAGVSQIYTFDRHLERISGIERLSPGN